MAEPVHAGALPYVKLLFTPLVQLRRGWLCPRTKKIIGFRVLFEDARGFKELVTVIESISTNGWRSDLREKLLCVIAPRKTMSKEVLSRKTKEFAIVTV